MLNHVDKIFKAFFKKRIEFSVDMIPFQFENVPFRKVINWFLTESSVFPKPSKPWGFPTLIHLEPTNYCNLRCVTCPTTRGLKRARGHMSLELFKKIIDELSPYLLLILLWDWGEPFLNPDVYDMIRYARHKKIKLISSTNGHVFAGSEQARSVVSSGLNALIFSVDGITQETYAHYRSGGRLDTVLNGIKNVAAEKRRQGSETPILNFRFIVMKHNEHELPSIEKFARKLDVDILSFRKFFPVVDNAQDVHHPDKVTYRRFDQSSDESEPVRVRKNPCKNLWNCPAIHWNGTLTCCTCDYDDVRVFGNLNESRFRDIWSGSPAKRMRRLFRNRWKNLPLCRDCVYAFEGGNMGRESVTEAVVFSNIESN